MPDQHKNDLNIEIIVGLFMFLVLIALGVFTIVLGRQNFLQEKHHIRVEFDEIGGLREGDNVFLRGVQVGTIKSTELGDNHVEVLAELTVPVEFREGYTVEVIASSMLGGKILKIDEGPLTAPVVDEERSIIGQLPLDILTELGDAVVRLRQFTEGLASGEGTIGKLLKDDSIFNDIGEGVASLKVVSKRLENGEGAIGKLLTDDSIYDRLSNSLATLDRVTQRLENGEGTLGKLLSDDNTMMNDLEAAIANLKTMTQKVNDGEGTLGMLMADDQLYHETQALLEEVRAAIDDMRETSPVTTFGSVVFGAF